MSGAEPSLQHDARWRLIERISASATFKKSERLTDLLRYLAEKTLSGATENLTERQIGIAVFSKPADYSILDDSSVRASVRLLRLKLHEYFGSEGREETCVVEIPKGGYVAVFRTVQQEAPRIQPKVSAGRLAMRLLPWALAALFLTIIILGDSFRHIAGSSATAPSWPLSVLFNKGNQPVLKSFVDEPPGQQEIWQGVSVHVCPRGYGMAGAQLTENSFTCLRMVPQGRESQVRSVLDAGTQADFGRGSMHVCPSGMYMRGLYAYHNWIICADGASLRSPILNANDATQGNGMHMCPLVNGRQTVITGIHQQRHDFSCAAAN
jgi:hypothetical protein